MNMPRKDAHRLGREALALSVICQVVHIWACKPVHEPCAEQHSVSILLLALVNVSETLRAPHPELWARRIVTPCAAGPTEGASCLQHADWDNHVQMIQSVQDAEQKAQDFSRSVTGLLRIAFTRILQACLQCVRDLMPAAALLKRSADPRPRVGKSQDPRLLCNELTACNPGDSK